MKHKLLILFSLIIIQSSFSQQKNGASFFNADFNLTFTGNEHFELGSDNGEPFLVPSGTLIRLGFGYEYKKRLAVSFNAGFDYHFPYSIVALPAYIGLQYNVWSREDDAFFIRINAGKLWRPSGRFSDGDYRAYGIGWKFESESRWKPTIKLMYHQKKINGFEDGQLESVSLGIGFTFF
ncbi:MAG: hypothetical protein JXR05_15750 [Flavobacteriaceae bacterium]